ncbi:hypothetical protein PRIC1_010046 [Phytophthora ramorum]
MGLLADLAAKPISDLVTRQFVGSAAKVHSYLVARQLADVGAKRLTDLAARRVVTKGKEWPSHYIRVVISPPVLRIKSLSDFAFPTELGSTSPLSLRIKSPSVVVLASPPV